MTTKKSQPQPQAQPQRKRTVHVSDSAEGLLMVPPRTVKAFNTLDDIKRAFSLPVTLGAPREAREQLDMAFDSMGGYDAIMGSLQQHAEELGEYPLTSFVGYGALQQIAQNGMIRSCIQTVADDITRKWIRITGGEGTDPEIIQEIEQEAESRWHLKKLVHDAEAKVGYMGGAFIFVDTGVEGEDLELPLAIVNQSSELTKDGELKFVVIDPVNVTPGDYNSCDPLRDDYMVPRWWWVLGKKVHRSRLITLFDNDPPTLLKPSYNFLGIPQAQILWDFVLHFNNCRVYTADLLRKVSLLVMQTDTDTIFSSDEGVRNFDLRMAGLVRWRDNNSVFVCDKNEEAVTNVQTSITGCTDIVRQCLEMIAAINRTPAVKLLGISPSGFNSTGESDITNYYDHIAAKQALIKDQILTCLKCIQLNLYGEIDPAVAFEFNELSSENSASVAMTASTRSQTLGNLLDRQVISPEEARVAVKKDRDMGLNFIDEEMPEELQGNEMQDMGGEGEGGGGLEAMMQRQGQTPQQGMTPPQAPEAKEQDNGEA